MTFDSNMQETEVEALPEFYRITGGGYEWRYTSYRTDLTFIGETYKAATIKRSGFSNTKQVGESKVTLAFPLSDPLKKYISTYPIPSTAVQVYRAIYSDLSQYALLFDGKVKKATFNNKVINVECSVDDEMTIMLPHIVYQSYCNWNVFDCYCGLDAEDYKVTAVLSSVSGSDIVSATFSAYVADWFTQGYIQFEGDFRFVTAHSGSTISLHVPFPSDLIAGETVYAFPGCDGSPATCRSKFSNFTTGRHVSMSQIPSHNPVIWGFK